MKREELLHEYEHFRAMGFKPLAIPARLGISHESFYRAMRRARLEGDPRAAGDEWMAERMVRPTPKLTFEDAQEIRRVREAEGLSYQKLADRFGVSKQAVMQVVLGRSWTSATPPRNTPKETRRAS